MQQRSNISDLERNRQVKNYIESLFCPSSPQSVLHALKTSEEAGLKKIQVPVGVGKLLAFITKLLQPKSILEIGTLGGYSTLWLAEGLISGGKLITIERDPYHCLIASKNFSHAGKDKEIEIFQGDALDLFQTMAFSKEKPFDLIFLDAGKAEYPRYLPFLIDLSRPGTVLLSDNLIPKRGAMEKPDPRDAEAIAIYQFNQMLAHHPRLETVLLPTLVGEGQIDALGLTIVR